MPEKWILTITFRIEIWCTVFPSLHNPKQIFLPLKSDGVKSRVGIDQGWHKNFFEVLLHPWWFFWDQFFGRRLGRRIVTKKVQYSVSKPLWYRGSMSDPYAEGPGFESLWSFTFFLPKNWSLKYHHGCNKITKISYVKVS